MIEAGRVAEPDRVGRREQPERRMRLDHAALVEQRQPAGRFQHALDHEHHVRPPGVVFVEAERDVVLIGPGQDAVAELGDLLAFLQHDRVLADEIDTADVAVEVDAHARPVEPRRHLLDMGRLAGAVIAGDDDAAVPGEAGENGERRLAVEEVVLVDIGNVLVRLREGGHLEIGIDPEELPGGNRHIGNREQLFGGCSHREILLDEGSGAWRRESGRNRKGISRNRRSSDSCKPE